MTYLLCHVQSEWFTLRELSFRLWHVCGHLSLQKCLPTRGSIWLTVTQRLQDAGTNVNVIFAIWSWCSATWSSCVPWLKAVVRESMDGVRSFSTSLDMLLHPTTGLQTQPYLWLWFHFISFDLTVLGFKFNCAFRKRNPKSDCYCHSSASIS